MTAHRRALCFRPDRGRDRRGRSIVKRQIARTGEKSFDTAAARGTLAVGYARAGRDADAIREFKTAMPIMMAAAHENSEEDDPTLVAARNVRLQRSVEFYIGVLARTGKSNDVAVETFALADAVRGHAVQQALANSTRAWWPKTRRSQRWCATAGSRQAY